MSLFRKAVFHTTVANLHDLPADSVCEVAFAGRSNAGKSSAINTLAHHTRLAFVSKTPGLFRSGRAKALPVVHQIQRPARWIWLSPKGRACPADGESAPAPVSARKSRRISGNRPRSSGRWNPPTGILPQMKDRAAGLHLQQKRRPYSGRPFR